MFLFNVVIYNSFSSYFGKKSREQNTSPILLHSNKYSNFAAVTSFFRGDLRAGKKLVATPWFFPPFFPPKFIGFSNAIIVDRYQNYLHYHCKLQTKSNHPSENTHDSLFAHYPNHCIISLPYQVYDYDIHIISKFIHTVTD